MPYAKTSHDGEIEIYYEDDGAGEPVVLIGGFTSTAEVWNAQVPALSAKYRVLRPDNRGSGRTRLIQDDGGRSMARFAGDVCALLDALKLDRVHLCGASMGGMIVQEFAARYPGRLRSLVVACSHPGGELKINPDPEVMVEFGRGSAGTATEAERTRTLEIVFHPRALDEMADAVAEYGAAKIDFPHSPEELGQRSLGVAQFDVSDRLASIPVPTLVICGSDDLIVPPENSRRIQAALPDAEWITVSNAGHVFFAQAPDACNAAFLRFFDRHASS